MAMVGQANHCIQQHVALAHLPLGAHRGVPDEGAFLSRTWPGLQGGCIAKTPSTTDLRLDTPPLQKSMGDFLQARID